MPVAQATRPSTRRLSEVARHVVYPADIVSSGWPRVRAQCAEMGITFDGWQDGVGTLTLGKRSDGKYAATVGGIVLSIPRQVGKTFLVGAIVIALCILYPGLTVLWTAHRTRTATKTFQSLQGMVRRRKIWPHIAPNGIRTANGEQEIKFVNGSVIMFGAREQGFGRGFDEVDVEVFDEGQILTEKALEDMVPAANQSRHESGALLFFIGTPPRPSDPGDEFANRRSRALSGKSKNMVYVEFSADRDADPDDHGQWARANPSFPHRTPVESMERMRENLTDDDSFRREALGIWDAEQISGVIPPGMWDAAGDVESEPVGRMALGIEVGPDLQYASVALAGQRADGDWHVSVDEAAGGIAWVVPHVRGLLDANPGMLRAVVLDEGSPAKALLPEFAKAKVRVYTPTVRELGAGCACVLNGVVTRSLRHRRQRELTLAALDAGKRPLGDTGMWVWNRKTAVGDITPIQAVTLALIGAQSEKPRRPDVGGQSYFKSY